MMTSRLMAVVMLAAMAAMPAEAMYVPPPIPTLVNGNLTGSIANAQLPGGWRNIDGTPDTMDEDNNLGLSGRPFTVDPAGPSPAGGTWVGLARDPNFLEAFGQDLTGFEPGARYRVLWYAGNFGAEIGQSYSATNAVEVLLSGQSIGRGAFLPVGPGWHGQWLDFTATAETHTLGFRLFGAVESYMSIDGVLLGEGAPLPSVTLPGSGVCLALSFVALRRFGCRLRRPTGTGTGTYGDDTSARCA